MWDRCTLSNHVNPTDFFFSEEYSNPLNVLRLDFMPTMIKLKTEAIVGSSLTL